MKQCPITYERIAEHETYSKRGLHQLSPQLQQLQPLAYDSTTLRQQALARVGKMSVQGIQPKLSARLKVKAQQFELVDQKGHYILKPQSDSYPEVPENEAISMTLAKRVGIEVPVHGLIYAEDNSLTYFIKRFDRVGHAQKIATEDFAQLAGEERDTKYASSMEKVAALIETFCTFPKIEYVKLFKLTLFNFLIGNEDMHLKNFSVISRDNKVMLSPAYDLLNTTIALQHAEEELALPLNGKKQKLRRRDLVEYFGAERLQLNAATIADVLQQFRLAIPVWQDLLGVSFLSSTMRQHYLSLLQVRAERLQLG